MITAHTALAVDDLSGGRLTLGLGTGWAEREHTMFGFDLLPLKDRFDRFQEGLEVIHGLLRCEDVTDFEGKYYHLHAAHLLPRPQRPGGPRIMIGGRGSKRTLHLAAKYADEWNTFRLPLNQVAALSLELDQILPLYSRKPEDIRRSLMVNIIFGKDDADVRQKMQGKSFEFWREKGLVGTASQIIDQIGEYGQIGIQRIMLQWFDLDDIDQLEAISTQIMPKV